MPRVRASGTDVSYEAAGGGPPVVCLVHGTGGRGGVWMSQIEGLANVARVVAPDLPGHGQTGGALCRSIAQATAFVARFLDALGADRAVIGGHSMGGAIAQEFALTHPGRVLGLALVGTGARLRVLPRLLDLLDTDYPAGVDLLMRMGVGAGASPALRAMLHHETAANPQAVVVGDLRACERLRRARACRDDLCADAGHLRRGGPAHAAEVLAVPRGADRGGAGRDRARVRALRAGREAGRRHDGARCARDVASGAGASPHGGRRSSSRRMKA